MRILLISAASLAVLSEAEHGSRIDGLVLLSPWLDLRVSATTYSSNAATDSMFSRESADVAAELYLQGFEPTHPLASPLLAPIASFPPTLISVGTGEVLYGDARLFHAKLAAAGVASQIRAIDGMEHVAVVRGLDQPGAAQARPVTRHGRSAGVAGPAIGSAIRARRPPA